MKKILSALSVALLLICQVGALGLHVYTIVVLFGIYGIVAAVIAFCLPVLSEIFCFFKSISVSGYFFNTYTASFFFLIGGFIISFICSALSEYIENKKVEKMENNTVDKNNVQDIEISDSDFDTMFANMDILELEDIVRNKQAQYRPEVYSVACKQFTERYNADPYIVEHANVEDILHKIDSSRQKPMKWYYWMIYFWLPVAAIRGCVDLINSISYNNSFILYIDSILICIIIFTEVFMFKMKRKGLWFFCALLLLELVFYMISALATIENLGSVIGWIVFIALNYIYFLKRWHLFKD